MCELRLYVQYVTVSEWRINYVSRQEHEDIYTSLSAPSTQSITKIHLVHSFVPSTQSPGSETTQPTTRKPQPDVQTTPQNSTQAVKSYEHPLTSPDNPYRFRLRLQRPMKDWRLIIPVGKSRNRNERRKGKYRKSNEEAWKLVLKCWVR